MYPYFSARISSAAFAPTLVANTRSYGHGEPPLCVCPGTVILTSLSVSFCICSASSYAIEGYFAKVGYTSGDETYIVDDIQKAVAGEALGDELSGLRFSYFNH